MNLWGWWEENKIKKKKNWENCEAENFVFVKEKLISTQHPLSFIMRFIFSIFFLCFSLFFCYFFEVLSNTWDSNVITTFAHKQVVIFHSKKKSIFLLLKFNWIIFHRKKRKYYGKMRKENCFKKKSGEKLKISYFSF